MEQIFGIIERVTFHNEENGFTVARLKQPRKKNLTTIIGVFPPLSVGESVRLHGIWKTHTNHGAQFEVSTYRLDTPNDCEGILKYLSSGMIRGIGITYAQRIVEKFKEQTLEVIEHSPEQLLSIEGIGEKRLENICQSWKEQQSIRKIMVFLQAHNISPSFARRIYRQYGEETTERLKENPYALATDVTGIGFKSADQVAQNMGFPKESSLRIDAGIIFVLNELAAAGHTCYPKLELYQKAEEILTVPIEDRISAVLESGLLIEQNDMLFLRKYWVCEQAIAHHLRRLLYTPSNLRPIDFSKAVEWVEKQLNITLATQQKYAVRAALCEKVLIITGGPGTGKSTITNAILAILQKLTRKILLAAPTGRAAKRMSEITHHEASTIHSLLKFSFKEGRFKYNKECPLDCDLLIVDEVSMLDTLLATSLLAAIPSHARLILVGDVCQLPSVGAGSVLQDLINSQKVPVITLTEIYRQAAGSKIVTNAHLVNKGSFPDLSYDSKSDFFFCKAEDPTMLLDKVVELVSKRLSKRFHPLRDIQVLAPMKKGPIGIEQLNHRLQAALNPRAQDHHRFRVGDKVMQLRNDYDKEVYNGDIGEIISMDDPLIVSFDGKEVPYPLTALEDLSLAYAISVHKFQGSECPCVIIVVHPSHFMMLQRNLLYTAITRGKKLVILVGTAKAIGMAVGRSDAEKRHTGLLRTLIEGSSTIVSDPLTYCHSLESHNSIV